MAKVKKEKRELLEDYFYAAAGIPSGEKLFIQILASCLETGSIDVPDAVDKGEERDLINLLIHGLIDIKQGVITIPVLDEMIK